ncbi:MAG: shikimate dehydrogenase family protein [Acidimicrobiia bacterium]
MRLALFGSPVARSLSPAIHTAALEAAHIAGSYDAIEVDAAGLAGAIDELRRGTLDGANVTMPHKQLACELSDRGTESAARAGAANTLVRVGASVVGHNTDVSGIASAWRAARLDPEGPVLVLGAGGAAAAALVALEGRPRWVSARTEGAASQLIDAVGVAARVTPFGDGVEGATVVNATPLGMDGETLPEQVLARCRGLFEMAYTSGRTLAEQAVAAAGMPTSSGVQMLVAQAADSFRLWTGVEAPLDAMNAAVRGLLTNP